MRRGSITVHPALQSLQTARSRGRRSSLRSGAALNCGKDIRRYDMSGLYEFICGGAMGALIALLFFALGANVQRKLDGKDDNDDT
jgi:hypothetical protein